MKVLNKEEISNVLGGRWITLPDGTRQKRKSFSVCTEKCFENKAHVTTVKSWIFAIKNIEDVL